MSSRTSSMALNCLDSRTCRPGTSLCVMVVVSVYETGSPQCWRYPVRVAPVLEITVSVICSRAENAQNSRCIASVHLARC
ncbi:hypothetical protein BV20DRAFT_559021 [Pilatotrama ljubarskyi]|nr:hypothetical protein BV20DRAFT_559021 [Pilatotrama ljubarskyi]